MVNPDPKFQDKQRFVKIKFMGSSCVVPPEAVAQMVEDDFSDREPGEEYTTEDVWLTPHEYDNLPEFNGW
jgi:hypothetical protein